MIFDVLFCPKITTKAKLYPSITNGSLTIENVVSYDLINTFGQVAMSFSDLSTPVNIDISNLPNGVYVIRGLDNEGVSFLEKIVKQ